MKDNILSLSAINSFLISQFLFFIDEGFYDFRWMMSWRNWVIFTIYFLILFGLLLLINKLLKKITINTRVLLGINLLIFPLLLLMILPICKKKKKTPNYSGVFVLIIVFFSFRFPEALIPFRFDLLQKYSPLPFLLNTASHHEPVRKVSTLLHYTHFRLNYN